MSLHRSPSRIDTLRSAVLNQRGASLIVSLGLVLLLSLLAFGTSRLVMSFVATTHQVERAAAAYFSAEAGIELALYDLSAYEDGYEYNSTQSICGANIAIGSTVNFGNTCSSANPYRVANFASNALSGARGFWRAFGRALPELATSKFVIPNPYFAGDKDGNLAASEWGRLTKHQNLSFALAIDADPTLAEIDSDIATETPLADRFDYLDLNSGTAKVALAINSGSFSPTAGLSTSEPLVAWAFTALDDTGEEHTLQGVIQEDDFISQDCDADGIDEPCFVFDFKDSGAALLGEDINKNIGNTLGPCISAGGDCINDFNRVSGFTELFNSNLPEDFLSDLTAASTTNPWRKPRVSFSLIGTLSQTSGVSSDALSYRVLSDAPIADEVTYIVSEGFAGEVKQAIETKFRRQDAIPVFSYVIFQ